MSLKDNLERFDNTEEVGFIPEKNNRVSPINNKILSFLGTLDLKEVRRLRCVSTIEANSIKSRMQYVSSKILNKSFLIAQRQIDADFFVFIERKE